MNSIPIAIAGVFVFGVIVGSFLNVIILRMNTGRGVSGRSMCFSCGKKLGALELIPVISFLLQSGRCKNCSRKISWQYPIIEILTGTVFALVASRIFEGGVDPEQLLVSFLFLALIFSLLIIIATYDFRHKIIPDRAVYLFIFLSAVSPLIIHPTQLFFGSVWLDHGVAGVALALPFALIWFLSQGRLMGLGDAKLALGIGFFLGLSQGISAIMLAFWIGALVGIILLLLKTRTLTIKSEIPFAPFLVLGTAIAFLCAIDLSSLARLFTWS